MPSTGVNLDPIAEAQRALAAHFNAALPAALAASGYQIPSDLAQRVQDGWADLEQEILEPDGTNAPKGAVVTITAPIPGEDRPQPPRALQETLDGATDVEVLWHVGDIEIPLQVDVWAQEPGRARPWWGPCARRCARGSPLPPGCSSR
jgi:hypothetical protein